MSSRSSSNPGLWLAKIPSSHSIVSARRRRRLKYPGCAGQHREEVREALGSHLEKPTITWNPHDRLRDAERDDLRVCDALPGVPRLLRQEIVSRAVNDGTESVEVGVHRGLQVDGALDTADFGLSAQNPSNTAQAVESTI
jgi:hypothetical protein